jgi:hypothetical protein
LHLPIGNAAFWSHGQYLDSFNPHPVLRLPIPRLAAGRNSGSPSSTHNIKAVFQVGVSLSEGTPWDISHDGKRFLMMKEAGSAASAGPPKINIVLNWLEELKRRVPGK